MRLHAGSVPDGQHPWRCLWNTDAFYGLRDAPCWHEPLVDRGGQVLGDLTYHADLSESGWRAPYGGPDWRREYWAPELIAQALRPVWRRLPSAHVKMKPGSYGENEAAALSAMLTQGWSVQGDVELSYSIVLPDTVDTYEQALPRQTRSAIKRAEAAGLHVVEPGPGDEPVWAWAHEVLTKNREAKGRPMSIDLPYLRAIRDAFPGLVRLLCVAEGWGAMPAVAIVYRIGAGRDYVQSWGDLPGHQLPVSPMPLLVRDLVAHSISTGATRLDLGSSSENGEPNGGLCRFKRSVGAVAEPRFVLGR